MLTPAPGAAAYCARITAALEPVAEAYVRLAAVPFLPDATIEDLGVGPILLWDADTGTNTFAFVNDPELTADLTGGEPMWRVGILDDRDDAPHQDADFTFPVGTDPETLALAFAGQVLTLRALMGAS